MRLSDSEPIHWDHSQPFALGGPTSEDNLWPMFGFDSREKEAGRVVRKEVGARAACGWREVAALSWNRYRRLAKRMDIHAGTMVHTRNAANMIARVTSGLQGRKSPTKTTASMAMPARTNCSPP